MAGETNDIGCKLDALRRELSDVADEFLNFVDGPVHKFVQDAKSTLQSATCQIAVIGQVKAGKSSFINSLIRRPEFLPTDVNPWTTAVTRLHFGQRHGHEKETAVFRFFAADEWQRLAQGGGTIRELTQRLVPGFEPDSLTRMLESMRERAALRLGNELGGLLGTSHTFPDADRKTLEAYVCTGTLPPSKSSHSEPGRYSDITKSADLWMTGGPFSFPVTLIDTPGTNDPFLVRDEITRQCLETADLYIVVLSARQAFSTADVALFRILRALRKERIVVFVNRIDELADLNGDLDAVRAQVERGLRQEFSAVQIPVVYGSALWANQALAIASESEVSAQLPSREARGAMLNSSAAIDRPAPEDAKGLLHQLSGMPLLARVLDRSLMCSHPAHLVRHLARSFAELSRLNSVGARDELRKLMPLVETAMHSARSRAAVEGTLTGELGRLEALEAELAHSMEALDAAIKSTAERELRSLGAALSEVVERFTKEECFALGHAVHESNCSRVWHCDSWRLRQSLEETFSHLFGQIESRVMAAEAQILPSIQRALHHILPGELPERGFFLRPAPLRMPSVGALGNVVALDLDEPWWKRWWTGTRSGEERMSELDRLIRAEFTPVVEELVRSAREQLLAQISGTVEQTRVVCLGALGMLRAQSKRQATRFVEHSRADSEADLNERLRQQYLQLSTRLKSLEAIGARIQAAESGAFA